MISTYGLWPSGTFVFFSILLIAQSLSCPTNCETCHNDNICERCVDGYYNGHLYVNQQYLEIKNCSLKCSENCEACTSNKTCTKCKPGFCIDTENITCQRRCNDINCESCASCDVCTRCFVWYYGKTCEQKCRDGCKDGLCNMENGHCSCRQNFQGKKCDMCVLGKYGYNCDKNCSTGCQANICDKQRGVCDHGCKQGYKRPYCNSCVDGFYLNGNTCENCPNTCLKCTSSNYCSMCKPGFWGYMCHHTCPETCKFCVSGTKCQKCIQGHYGPSCNDICPEGCESNICSKNDGHFRTCKPGYSGHLCDTCDVGFWGEYCNTSCSRGCLDDKCTKDTGTCIKACKHRFTGENCDSCVKGFHGKECSACPRNCEICTSNVLCSRCRSGYWGPRCSIRCPQNCDDKTCDKLNGSCTSCIEGFFGAQCETKCPETCATNTCNAEGTCFACNSGYFGANCSNVCPSNCEEKCQRRSGYCRSCIDGYFGNLCDRKCPENCLSCISETNCSYCKTGFKGTICEYECSNCKYGTKCRQHDGFCEKECADGLYDTMCDRTCSKECKTCARTSHFRCSSCIHGKYGKRSNNGETYLTCKLNCSAACFNNSCNEENGQCLHGCLQGRFWGSYCKSFCPRHCKNGKCSVDDGACSEGCEEGYFGRKCSWRCNVYDSYCSACLADENYQYEGCIMCNKGYYPTNGLIDQLKHKRCGPCSPNCSLNECNTTNGFCLHGCIMGLWGRECEKSCDLNCLSCNQTSGDCLKCTDGRYGIRCLENCSINCGRRNGVPVCIQNDGQCLNDCSKKTSYGTYCENECSKNCLNGECHWKTGHCILGCINGFHGKICDMPCSKNCVNNTCNRLGGDCSVGCQPGFEGTACTRVTSGINLSVIIGTGSALIVILIGITTTVICKCHKRNRTKPSLEMRERHRNINVDHVEIDNRNDMNSRPNVAAGSSKESGNLDNRNTEARVEYAYIPKTERFLTQVDSSEEVEIESYEDENLRGVEATQTTMFTIHDDGTYYNTAAVLKRRVPIDKLKEFVSKKTMDDFIKEFKELPVGLIKPYGISQTTENFKKNRYRGLYPYDKRRVVIRQNKDDYINASYIDGHNKKNAYIACMGPTTKHMGVDFAVFWEMIWQESVSIIVMLTNLKELGVPKCDKYWPDRGSQGLYGDVQVTCLSEDIMTDYTIRTFTVQKTQKRKLYQMHFTSWPDKGIPESVHSLTDFQNRVNNLNIVTSGPVVVHCSAGIGRTGTYIALDILTKEGRSEKYVDIFACARNMREDRVNMIQTADQYMFLHQSLVHVLTG
ncbi:multiple epidermal growth factor-like domains protein 10 isoform X2 [Mercenaria mercenaria]|uniref:multiple epidermal growth factor-like domains protein 10 isoform X2 n=1 Tax=Mercenaria mercenaria TaxID=6596 RepID=UPI00234F3D21|nr:multiple epidermal growth factor-like domains protein 10 isoform X2 [Mercenaria mercenaria]